MKHNLCVALPALTGAVILSLSAAPLLPVTAAPAAQTASAGAVSQITDYSAVFDADYYYQTYPDLQTSIGNDPAVLLSHFIKTGMAE